MSPVLLIKEGDQMSLKETTQKLKSNKFISNYFGTILLLLLVLLFWSIFKILAPNNFGSPDEDVILFSVQPYLCGWRMWFVFHRRHGFV